MFLSDAVRQTKVFLLDMDGTVYFDETPIGDMKNTLGILRKNSKKIVFLTNNSSKTQEEYVDKLKKIGLWEEGDYVYTSAMATCEYLKRYRGGQRVYLVATDEVKKSFEEVGITLAESSPDVCVLAYDTTLTFEKLKKINKFIVEGAFYIATHPDDVCPSKDVFPPDVGSFISLLKTSSGRTPDLICGKPYPVMAEGIMKKTGVNLNEMMMVGDRLHTDILFGLNSGIHTLLVLSGETTREMLENSTTKPENVLTSLNEIVNYL